LHLVVFILSNFKLYSNLLNHAIKQIIKVVINDSTDKYNFLKVIDNINYNSNNDIKRI
jgi:hypothetical protein